MVITSLKSFSIYCATERILFILVLLTGCVIGVQWVGLERTDTIGNFCRFGWNIYRICSKLIGIL